MSCLLSSVHRSSTITPVDRFPHSNVLKNSADASLADEFDAESHRGV